MKILKVEEREYRINERDYKKLLARFNVNNAKEDGHERIKIGEPCVCPSGRNCKLCCLGPRTCNCLGTMKRITGKRRPSSLNFYVGSIWWGKNSKASFRYIDTIYQTLLALAEVTNGK